jgi:hypothetical protein
MEAARASRSWVHDVLNAVDSIRLRSERRPQASGDHVSWTTKMASFGIGPGSFRSMVNQVVAGRRKPIP